MSNLSNELGEVASRGEAIYREKVRKLDRWKRERS